jgi:hypothetical protein
MKKYLAICFLCAGAVFFTHSVSAQDIRSDVSGFYANINITGGTWNTSSAFLSDIRDSDPNSVGVQISGGYGFTQQMEGFAHVSVSNFNLSGEWETYSHTEFGVGFRYNFGATLKSLRPFADVQINSSSIEIDRVFVNTIGGREEGALELDGTSLIAGGGFRYFIKPWFALNLHLRYHVGTDYGAKIGGADLILEEELDFNQFDAGAGVTWYFGKKF